MNDPTLLAQALNALGLGAYLPVALALIGLASAIATVYPPSWPGAAVLHKLALLFGRAAPAAPAGKRATPAAAIALLLGGLGAATLGACSAAQVARACEVDAAVVPAADAALAAAGGPAAAAGAVDATAVHPAVQAGCAALAAPAGKPAAHSTPAG
jgi:hypothetical protein